MKTQLSYDQVRDRVCCQRGAEGTQRLIALALLAIILSELSEQPKLTPKLNIPEINRRPASSYFYKDMSIISQHIWALARRLHFLKGLATTRESARLSQYI